MDRADWNRATVRGEFTIRVYVFHTDMVGVVYNARYLEWFEIGRSELMRERGVPYSLVERRGVSLPVTGTQVSIRSAARYDDLITIETRIGRVRSRDVVFLYQVRRDAELLAEGETTHVPVSRETGRACAFPAWIASALGLQT